jgi:hypothetical protein
MLARYVLASTMFMFAGACLLPVWPDLYLIRPENASAYVYCLLCTAAFFVGYLAAPQPPLAPVGVVHPSTPLHFRRKDLLLLALLGISGCLTLILQISITYGLANYIQAILYSTVANLNDLRYETVAISSAEGGLPGVIKMWNWNSVTAMFCFLAMLARGYRLRGAAQLILAFVIAVAFVVAAFLRQDRLSALSLLPVLLTLMAQLLRRPQNTTGKVMGAIAFICVIGLIAAQSSRRGTLGILGWVALYTQVGIVNLGLMMHSTFPHTLGFAGPLSALSWIGKAVGLNPALRSTTIQWVWSDVDNGFGYWFLDFGWFGAVLFIVLGACARLLDLRCQRSAARPGGFPWQELRWLFAYLALSFPFVPAYVGIEYWLMIVSVIYLMKRLGREPHSSLGGAREPEWERDEAKTSLINL